MARAALSLGLLSFLAFSPTLVSALQRGCYSDIGNLHIAMGSPFQSTGLCESHCQKSDYSVFGMRGEKCWCGDKLPLSSARVSNKECDTPCPGYPSDTCKFMLRPLLSTLRHTPSVHQKATEDGNQVRTHMANPNRWRRRRLDHRQQLSQLRTLKIAIIIVEAEILDLRDQQSPGHYEHQPHRRANRICLANQHPQ